MPLARPVCFHDGNGIGKPQKKNKMKATNVNTLVELSACREATDWVEPQPSSLLDEIEALERKLGLPSGELNPVVNPKTGARLLDAHEQESNPGPPEKPCNCDACQHGDGH